LLFEVISFNFFSQAETFKALDVKANTFIKSNELDSALFYAGKSLAEAEKIRSSHHIIRCNQILATIYVQQNKIKEAADCFYKALKLCKDTSENDQKMLIYNGLGLLNYQQGDKNKAKQFFKEEIKIRRTTNDKIRLANNLLNLSAMHRSLKEYDSSFYLITELKEIVNATRDVKLKGYFYNALAIHYHSLYKRDSIGAQLDSAINNYERSLAVWLKLDNKEEAFRPLFNLGHAYHDKKQYVKALGYYKRVEELTTFLKLFREKMVIYGNMAEAYYDLKDYKQTADYFRKYIEIKDSLNKTEIADYALRLDKQFQTEKHKETIQQQKLEIAEQELQINKQSKMVYLYLLVIVIVIVIAIAIFVYFNFQKRVDQKIEEAKRKFFSNVVHEIRTPLSMIQAPLKVLKGKYNSEDDQYNINIAERNINRLNELVNQMLDISKIESTRYTLNEQYGDLEIFLLQLVNGYTKIASEKNIILLHRFNLQNKLAFFDKDVLEKIVGNLLSNAIKYTTVNNQIGMDVDGYETESGLKLTISVWDTGAGISIAEQEKIFNRFYRSSETATITKGVGIGLSLVKDLVNLLNGTIEVKSREKKGSSFTVNLILKTQDEKVTLQQTEIDENAPLILLVEDDLEILNFNANYLGKNKFSVLKSLNGKDALELMEKTLPDLIITDLMMPEVDGLSLLRSVRKNEITNHIPIIVLSAKVSSESRMEALKMGAQAYLAKPFLPDELLTLVVNQLEILSKKKTDFKEQITQPEKTVEEKYVGTEPYTKKLFALIFQQLDNPELSVEGLADLMATNRSHFQRKVKAITGISPSDLIRIIRLEKAKEFLLAKKGNITEVAYQSGFSSQSYFTKCFTQHFGISPTQMLQDSKNHN
jgi:signal transduction histidine kinase/CheY-like chemotaxis protein/AraC-like DNA-binding protein